MPTDSIAGTKCMLWTCSDLHHSITVARLSAAIAAAVGGTASVTTEMLQSTTDLKDALNEKLPLAKLL